ncbi:uncharacterized protein LOC116404765 isoform X2 [Cucumis sativus]|uniref:Ulp1-like peptidase n=2 Tax=Cucumis sativus TaxID=3659 RepID=A0A6N0C7Z4_CUCSA|nr:uncharacterized protein LOC116404765 isoform X2 [Cucumis sativus]XP_031744034.1 uncharacterized protein LOC116404765 isoform X2 [Cucumis sativus]XP_031744035.1 uncharacterized protein LOC116404765 isoform X2 [Cucumis sativus]QKO28721.1 Ulp1-like peptidase [Cucumis sativus]
MASTSTNGPMYKIDPAHHFQSIVSSLAHLENSTRTIKAKLKPDQLTLFRNTKFGHFLDLNIIFNGPLIHYLLLREVEDERVDHISFKIGEVVCSFGRREFNMMTGLWSSQPEPIDLVGNSRLLEKFFEQKKCIYISDLEDTFVEYEGDDDDDDIVKLALVYFIEMSLLGKDRRTKVDRTLFRIADDWTTFNNYDWGGLVFGRTLSALKRALDMQHAKGKNKSTKTKYTVMGFPQALQVWAYESIPTITECGVHKVSNDAIPRMLRWVCELSPKSHVLQRQVFDSPMFLINVVIEMMPEEEEHLRMSSGELVEKTHPYNTVSEKNGDSKRPGEASNDDNDCKKSKKKKKWKSKMKEVVRKLKYRVAVLENERESLKSMLSTILKHLEVQKKGEEGDCTGVEGHDAQTEDVDTPGTPSWLRMPKEDDTSDGVKHVERQKQGVEANRTEDDTMDELDKKVHIHSEEPVDVVDDLNEEIGVKSLTYFDSDVMEIEPLSTERPHVRPARSKRASVYLSTPFTALDKRPPNMLPTNIH